VRRCWASSWEVESLLSARRMNSFHDGDDTIWGTSRNASGM
jgi:hypothetical protein